MAWIVLAAILLTAAWTVSSGATGFDMDAPDDVLLTPAPTQVPRVDPSEKMIAFTFDDGPSQYTTRILNAFESVGGLATFCMVGNRIGEYESIAKQVADGGHEIAIHTWDHSSLTKLSNSQIDSNLTKCINKIKDVTGYTPTMLRPPYGNVDSDVKAVAGSLGLIVINWSIDTEDWKSRNAKSVYKEIMENACSGAIVLCHDLYESTATAIEYAIPALEKEGYAFVTVHELLDAKYEGWKPGQLYYGKTKSDKA